jgi:hypothetical protein
MVKINADSLTELIAYELPWYADFVSIGWLQDIIARRVARKVRRKFGRYLLRELRHETLLKYKHARKSAGLD